ncbi:alpha/beta-hydrolase [Pluteus cervinus]|uniref:Alpha/beta-hydrolase n=1 Tax=Pluteus cervinus TaxID=181527 RepID=A0ACD3B5P7_9AGAR|nr:alpha/beta-hydrolase [Pluteus cervinus]
MSTGTGQILKLLLRHGQIPLVYPGAFFAEDAPVFSPAFLNLTHEDLELQTSDNNSRAKATLIMFHGNGMNYGDQIPLAERFHTYGFNVLTVSYRGYATSEGVPSERGLQRDAQAALDYLTTNELFSSKPIILYGLSLGGAVAIDLCSRNPTKIHALIVENTFKSLPDVVRGWSIIGNFSFLVFQRWNSASKIPKIPSTIPVLMLSGKHDQVVPQRHMLDLWELVRNRHCALEKPSKRRSSSIPSVRTSTSTSTATEHAIETKDAFHEFDRGTHANTWLQTGYWENVSAFVDCVLSTTNH